MNKLMAVKMTFSCVMLLATAGTVKARLLTERNVEIARLVASATDIPLIASLDSTNATVTRYAALAPSFRAAVNGLDTLFRKRNETRTIKELINIVKAFTYAVVCSYGVARTINAEEFALHSKMYADQGRMGQFKMMQYGYLGFEAMLRCLAIFLVPSDVERGGKAAMGDEKWLTAFHCVSLLADIAELARLVILMRGADLKRSDEQYMQEVAQIEFEEELRAHHAAVDAA